MVEVRRLRHSQDMSSCSCPRADLTAVTFDGGAVLLRCLAHEQQRWLVDGREVPSSQAMGLLREAFVAGRTRRAVRSTPRPTTVRMPDAPDVDPYPPSPRLTGRDASADLTALLRARGISGSWAVA